MTDAANAAVRVMLVDGDAAIRQRFAAAICSDARLLLTECLASGREALKRMATARPDVLLLGLQLSDLDAVDLVRNAKRMAAACEILVVVAPGDEQVALASLAAGAAGCVTKPCGNAELVAQVLQLNAGGCPIFPALLRLLLAHVRAARHSAPEAAAASAERSPTGVRLTSREAQVLRLISRGCSYAEIGRRLGVSAHTVASHIKKTYRKLEVHTAGAAVMRAMQLHLLGET